MNASERDAREYGLHEAQGEWRYALLVARSVERSKGGRPGNSPGGRRVSRLPIADFAKLATAVAKEVGGKAVGLDKVRQHLRAWESAAEVGLVPPEPKPGQEIALPSSELWTEHYTAVGGGRPRDKTPEAAGAILRDAPLKQVEQIVSELPPTTKKKLGEAIIHDPEAHMAVERAAMEDRLSKTEHLPLRKKPGDPTFMATVVKITHDLDYLAHLLSKWADASEIPEDFNAMSFDFMADKVLRIKDAVNALRSEDNDEWQRLVTQLEGN